MARNVDCPLTSNPGLGTRVMKLRLLVFRGTP